MKPSRPTQRKFDFKLSYSTIFKYESIKLYFKLSYSYTTTTKNKETLHLFRSIYLFTVSDY
jgi:hypothetical protein